MVLGAARGVHGHARGVYTELLTRRNLFMEYFPCLSGAHRDIHRTPQIPSIQVHHRWTPQAPLLSPEGGIYRTISP